MNQPTHGGKRPGAGRKPAGRKAYLIRMLPKTMKALKKAAKPKTVGNWLDDVMAGEKAKDL